MPDGQKVIEDAGTVNLVRSKGLKEKFKYWEHTDKIANFDSVLQEGLNLSRRERMVNRGHIPNQQELERDPGLRARFLFYPCRPVSAAVGG